MDDARGTVALTCGAYKKIVQHCAKNTYRPVLGLLLSSSSSGDAKESLTVSGVVPLLHNYALGPMLELAMAQAYEYCKEKKLQVVGCYWANELADDMSVHRIAKKVGACISKFFNSAFVLVIDNMVIGKELKKNDNDSYDLGCKAFQVKSEKQYDVVFAKSGKEELTNLKEWLSSKKLGNIVDFEDHLENVNLEWLNV
eukprot:jgi/Bigna1/132996/aug1.19_g7704